MNNVLNYLCFKENDIILSSLDKINFHKNHFKPYKIHLIIDDFICKQIWVHTLYINLFIKRLYFIIQNKDYIYIHFDWCFDTKSWQFSKGWYYKNGC
jgi:hypothetical protein